MTPESTSVLSADEKRAQWGDGPWCDEPDRIEWRARGSQYPCLMLRQLELGQWCGYVGVPPGHPLHGVGYDDDRVDLDVHGGLTFANRCTAGHPEHPLRICHTPQPGEPADVWWFGFDCAHAWDLAPGLVATVTRLAHQKGTHQEPHDVDTMFAHNVYRTAAYVRREVNTLARQLWAARKGDDHAQSAL